MGLHPVSAEVANGLIDQVVALSELGGIDPSDIGIICSATRKSGRTIDDPKAERGTDPMPQVQNPGMNVPAILHGTPTGLNRGGKRLDRPRSIPIRTWMDRPI